VIIFTDSLINYFLRTFFVPLPVNTLVIIPFFGLFLLGRLPQVTPRPTTLIWLMLAVAGYTTGVFSAPDITAHRFLEIASALLAFLVGFGFFKNNADEDILARLFLFVTIAYVVVCLVALSRTMPSLFPVTDQIWSQKGILQRRPEVTTDQNFQVFYLFPAALLLALPFQPKRSLPALFVVVGSLFILAKLQTRSGALIFLGTVFLALSSPIFAKGLGRKKVAVLPVLGFFGVLAAMPLIVASADLLIYRFMHTDYYTGLGRLHSFLYLFEHVWNPLWWIPQGNEGFVLATGNKPHSNITAAFLEGGLLGLVAWIALIFVPIIRLGHRFVRGRLSNFAVIGYLGCVAMFVIQLSLNVPMVDQVWLWAGVGVGLLENPSHYLRQRKPAPVSFATSSRRVFSVEHAK
jgi:hypothetical protein